MNFIFSLKNMTMVIQFGTFILKVNLILGKKLLKFLKISIMLPSKSFVQTVRWAYLIEVNPLKDQVTIQRIQKILGS